MHTQPHLHACLTDTTTRHGLKPKNIFLIWRNIDVPQRTGAVSPANFPHTALGAIRHLCRAMCTAYSCMCRHLRPVPPRVEVRLVLPASAGLAGLGWPGRPAGCHAHARPRTPTSACPLLTCQRSQGASLQQPAHAHAYSSPRLVPMPSALPKARRAGWLGSAQPHPSSPSCCSVLHPAGLFPCTPRVRPVHAPSAIPSPCLVRTVCCCKSCVQSRSGSFACE